MSVGQASDFEVYVLTPVNEILTQQLKTISGETVFISKP